LVLHALHSRLGRGYLDHRGFGSGRDYLAQIVASVDQRRCRLLDAACGEGNLRQQLPPAAHYVGVGRCAGEQSNEYAYWNMRPSVLGDVHHLPLASGSCRTVVLMQVLEHVREPGLVFAEIYRVLKLGGHLFVTVPFLHEIHHAPHDYYRYTPYAVTALAQTAELEVVEIRPTGGYFRALSHLLEAAPTVVRGTSVSSTLVRVVVAYPLKGLAWVIGKFQYLLDLQDAARTFTSGYHCVFRKP
jgi:SAM-dependent methyltransferase